MKYLSNYFLLSSAIMLGAIVAYIWFPTRFAILLGEDRGYEYLTVVFYLLSALIALVMLGRRKGQTRMYAMLVFLSLLFALEELSYGERILEFTAPKIVGVNIDTAHDLLHVAVDLLRDHMWARGVAIVLAVVGAFVLVRVCRRQGARLLYALRKPPYAFLLIVIVLGTVALAIDLNTEYGLAFMLEELMEMLAAVALVFCTLSVASEDLLAYPHARSLRARATMVMYALSVAGCIYYALLPAVEKIRISAEHRNKYAMYYYALRHYQGDGVVKDKKESLKWALRGAEADDPRAQLLASVQFYRGEGTARDLERSAYWCRRSAEEGHGFAAYCLGRMYYDGIGMEQDFELAHQWLLEAADVGIARAASLLGRMYEKGHGVAMDRDEAAKWFRLAEEYARGAVQQGFDWEGH